MLGSLAGTRVSTRLAGSKGLLNSLFAVMIVVVALYTLAKSWLAISA